MTAQDQASNSQDQGLRKFFRIWFGQVVSMLGTSMTGFALGVWVFQRTGSAT